VELLTASASPVNRINALMSLGKIRARRSEAGARKPLDEAVAAADGNGEPQWIIQARLARAEAYWLQGEPGSAAREAELADDVCARGDAWDRGAVAAWLWRTGSHRPPRDDLAEPYRLQLAGDWQEASRLWRSLGCPYTARSIACSRGPTNTPSAPTTPPSACPAATSTRSTASPDREP
jgi:hypothetical protein